MRPHLLEFSAIGSYAGNIRVDFDALSPHGLFHIHGPTGSGKSSLLDALCFALYGSVPSPRLADGLRSHHAVGAVEARTELEFSSQGRTWRILRSPTQKRAKRRGGPGTTEQRAEATLLKRQDGDWLAVASGVKEVDSRIHELLGLDADQFMQVVVLPQGGFQKALRAGSAERERLLSSLFHTERFGVYSERLKARASHLARGRDQQGMKAMNTLGQLYDRAAALDVELPNDMAADLATVRAIESAAVLIDEALYSSSAACTNAEREHRDLSAQVRVMAVAAERTRQRSAAREKLQAVTAADELVEQARALLERIRFAAPLGNYLERLDAATSEHHSLQVTRASVVSSAQELLSSLPPLADAVVTACNDRKAWKADRLHIADQQARVAHSALDALETLEEEVRKLERDASLHASSAHRAEELCMRLSGKLHDTQLQVQALDLRSEELRNWIAKGVSIDRDVERLASQLQASERLNDLLERERLSENAWRAAEKRSIESQRHHLDLLQRRLDGMAAELAAALADGEACMVCGSPEHPQPAQPQQDPVPASLVQQAEIVARNAAADANRAQETHNAVVADANAARADAGGVINDPVVARSELEGLREQQQCVRNAEIDIESVTAMRSSLITESEQLRLQIADASAAETAARTSESHLASRIAEARVRLQSGLGNYSCAQARTNLQQLLHRFDQLARIDEGLRIREDQVHSEQARFNRALTESPFDDADELREVLQASSHAERLEQQIDEHARSKTAAIEILEQLSDEEDVDLAMLTARESELSEASERLRILTSHLARREADAAAFRQLAVTFADQVSQLLPVQAEAERVAQLASICGGDRVNPTRMSLERYVLAAYLEEVAAAASERLRTMTSGRYTLRHSDARVRGNAASGLSLLVNDAYTGIEREVNTLSGGETFLASLALALGVADVVQQHAGGVHIEALFVDEGFGSLDADTLDLAMTELDRLREGGRLVGVISHVAALRQRIPIGIEVIPGPDGSSIRMVGVEAVSPVQV